MNLDAAAVDEQPIWRIAGTCQCAEDAFSNAVLGPANEAVAERLLRPIHIRAVSPAPSAAQRMDDPAQHPAIIHPRLAAYVGRQQRHDPVPLRVGKPKEICHHTVPLQRH